MSVTVTITDRDAFLKQLSIEGILDLYIGGCGALETAPGEHVLRDITEWGLVSIVQKCGVNIPIRDSGRFFAGLQRDSFETWVYDCDISHAAVKYDDIAMDYLKIKGFDPRRNY